jgi:signal transduction histidine kinase
VYKWYLPTLSEIIALHEPNHASPVGSRAQLRLKAEREWCGAIAALNSLLQNLADVDEAVASGDTLPLIKGVVLSGSLPVIDHPGIVTNFSTWTFTAMPLQATSWMPFHLLPSAESQSPASRLAVSTLPLLADDPLAVEQFCLVLTAEFCLVMALGDAMEGQSEFLFSFNPDIACQAWRSLRSRLILTNPQVLHQLDTLVEQFAPVTPDYQTVSQFSRFMLAALPEPSELGFPLTANGHKPIHAETGYAAASPIQPPDRSLEHLAKERSRVDVELLQAIAHEVRTPLSTIRTLTRLLLKRKDLNPDVIKRLETIDQECTDQVDRFNLIFRAVELETAAIKHPLTPPAAISLTQVFQQNVPRWQQQASQRCLTLEVSLPQKLPLVLADPTMLDQVLTGLIDRITHSLPPGSHIHLRVKLAGHQLKLQFQPYPHCEDGNPALGQGMKRGFTPTLKSIGEMLMFQPETGSLSLNLAVTKNLFQALGGKLIVRHRPQQGEELTIFLPLEKSS